MVLYILVISCFIYYNHIRTSNQYSGNDERFITNATEDLLEKERIIQYMKNMRYLNILMDKNMSQESKLRFLQDTMDIVHSISPIDLYGGGLLNEF
jgi:hypothetical protein